MIFGPRDVADAVGTILAHSVVAGKRRIRKGDRLTAADIADLQAAGVGQITVAELTANDVHEDAAAEQLARALIDQNDANLRRNASFTGRVNIYAERAGVLWVDATAINTVNGIDPSITVSTLDNWARVENRSLLATIKIIPFSTDKKLLEKACRAAVAALALMPFKVATATLIQTETTGFAEKILDKGQRVIAARLQKLGCGLTTSKPVPHKITELAEAITGASSDLVLILTASATSDENDVGPAALRAAGGELIRFGMPVDPGNLLFLGKLGAKTVVGLPGCARSPALNGADWVLERLVTGTEISGDDIAAMGVGGLLKEIPTRPQSRSGDTLISARPNIEVILLAAGGSSRMRGVDKLLEDIGGEPLLERTAQVALASQADRVTVVIPEGDVARSNALSGLDVAIVPSVDWRSGMAASLTAGLNAVSQDCDAVVIALADMPDVTPDHIDRLIAGFDPAENREICRAVAENGKPGHPVLFGRRFFESLATLRGDKGARDIVKEASEFIVDVATPGDGAVVDLDTPEDWTKWRNNNQ